jgi:hypothetical protein
MSASEPSTLMNDDGLLKLMHIRDVHALPGTGIPPSRWPAAPGGRGRHEAMVEAGANVRRHWLEAITWHAGGGARRQATLLAAETGDVDAVREVIPPAWDPGVEALLDLDRYTEWFLALPAAPHGLVRAGGGSSGVASTAAASRGLRVMVVLPLREPHASQMGDNCLLLSWGVYSDESQLVLALDGFARGAA